MSIMIFLVLLIFFNAISGEEDERFNAVIFLVNTQGEAENAQECKIMESMNFQEIQLKNSDPKCDETLKTGMFALISYCKNVMGMTAAVASLLGDESPGRKFTRSRDPDMIYNTPRKLKEKIPINIGQNPRKWLRNTRIATNPQHLEIFKVRSKRHVKNRQSIRSKEKRSKEKPKWKLFGIMSIMRLTLLGKIFDDSEDENVEDEQPVGTTQEMALYDLVEKTYQEIEEAADPDSFLMVVIGGALADLHVAYSSLVQSVKFIVENVEEENTLIVITGSCPNQNSKSSIPVYIRGPQETTTSLQSLSELPDLPSTIKEIISDKNKEENTFTESRKKREIEPAPLKGKSSTVDLSVTLIIILFFLSFFHNYCHS